ncbi:MAG: hypothetical protein ACU88J_04100 [Gammaproteobacteria bacterium]
MSTTLISTIPVNQKNDIPKNKLGFDEADLLHEIEANHFKDAYRLFLDELYFKLLRRRTFGALYEWTGGISHG